MCSIDSRINGSELSDDPACRELSDIDWQWKRQVAHSFEAAAESYEQHSHVQRQAADSLFKLVSESVVPDSIDTALEIGCGTGYLTRLMLPQYKESNWTVTDVSPKMLELCRSHLDQQSGNESQISFAELDGEFPDLSLAHDAEFDLICSNLAFQWFVDLDSAISRILNRVRAGGWLFFTTLATDNFSQVIKAYPCLAGRINQPISVTSTCDKLSDDFEFMTSLLKVESSFDDLSAFLNSLKAIGAGVSRYAGSREPSSSDPELRKAIRRSKLANEPVVADYQIRLVAIRKIGSADGIGRGG